ncbi:MAG: LPS export ABC transporter permease LptG [Alphaproteobacteria bacterium]|jgi:lipopolysaccharide export system permease protein|nr:LPS export ABC transporter permease LptG [Alphaproteobacteria bacterium]
MIYLFSTLNFYFCRVLLVWLGACTIIISTLISLFEGSELIRRSIGKPNIDLSIIFEMIILKLPNHFQILLPFIVLMSTMVVFYRLNHTQEIVAARSSGLSIWQFLSGLMVFVLTLGFLQLVILNPLSAAMSNRLENLDAAYFSGASSRIAISETGLWLRESTTNRQTIIHTGFVQPNTKTFTNVTFHNYQPNGTYETRIDATSAILQKGHWELRDAVIWQDKEGAFKNYPIMKIATPLTIEKIQDSNTSPETISFWSLPKFIDILDKSGLSSINYRLYWHGQIAKLGIMMAMILLAAAFGIRPIRQGGTVLYITMGICSGFALYFLNDIVYALGRGGQIPILLAAWAPTLIMTLLSLALLLHLEDG